jgi:leucyl aminopeptidase
MEQAAAAMAREFGLRMEVPGPSEFEKYGMTAFLEAETAAPGSCKLIVLKCDQRKGKGAPIVLVGTGVTDGRSSRLQEQRARRDPIRNMRGAGSVLGAMRTVVRLGLALNLVGLILASEDEATEAERGAEQEPSLLTDVLSYAAHFSPSCVIDVATLTRACAIALGNQASGLFTNDEALAAELLKCGGNSGDRVWQLPIWDEDRQSAAEQRGEADQAADSPATAIAAASNLARFATPYPWAHLDISGTASTIGRAGTSTGRPVPLLAEFLIGRARTMPGRPLSSPHPRTELHS